MFLLFRSCLFDYCCRNNIYIPICFYYFDGVDMDIRETQIHLHSNMFLLFQGLVINGNDLKRHLHSNMFLLFRKPYRCITTIASTFTFQYVSIISYLKQSKQTCKISFTFQYVSIISKQENCKWSSSYYLHSNMFLLFPVQCSPL